MKGGLLMTGGLLFPFHSYDTLFLVSRHEYNNNGFYTVIPRVTTCMGLGFSPEETAAY